MSASERGFYGLRLRFDIAYSRSCTKSRAWMLLTISNGQYGGDYSCRCYRVPAEMNSIHIQTMQMLTAAQASTELTK